MMCCKFDKWLQSEDAPTVTPLPESLTTHLAGCSECREKSEILKAFRQSYHQIRVPRNVAERVWRNIAKTLPPVGGHTASGDLSALCRSTWLTGPIVWGVGAAVVVGLWLGATLYRSSNVTTSAPPGLVTSQPAPASTISGEAASLRREVRDVPLGPQPQVLNDQDTIRLTGDGAWVALDLSRSGTLRVEGRGQLKIHEKKVQVVEGSQIAVLRSGREDLTIEIPGATLRIRQGRFRWNFDGKEGTIDLLEGRAEVEPIAEGLLPFSWGPGTRLQIRAGRLTGLPEAICPDNLPSFTISTTVVGSEPPPPSATGKSAEPVGASGSAMPRTGLLHLIPAKE